MWLELMSGIILKTKKLQYTCSSIKLKKIVLSFIKVQKRNGQIFFGLKY